MVYFFAGGFIYLFKFFLLKFYTFDFYYFIYNTFQIDRLKTVGNKKPAKNGRFFIG